MPKPRVIVDTCIIIEAFRTQSWNALCRRFDMETVDKCVEECSTGDPLDPKRTLVPRPRLMESLAQCHAVSDLQLARLSDEVPGLPGIDDGELHLMAWLHANHSIDVTLLLSTSDRAAIRAASALNLLDQVRSLEVLMQQAGSDARQIQTLKDHFREGWMGETRLKIKMGIH